MRRNCKCVVLCLSIVTLIMTFTMDTTAQSVQRRKRKKTPAKTSATIKNSSASKEPVSSHDIGVEVQSTPFGKVVILTNREKSPITVRQIVINDEWEIKSSTLLHSTKSWTSLPVELMLGDTLRVSVSPYKRDVIYVDLYTDKGKLTFKVKN